MMRRLKAVISIMLMLTISFPTFADPPATSLGVQVGVPCDNGSLGAGQRTNDATHAAIIRTHDPNWVNNHTGWTVYARYANGQQVTYVVTVTGTLNAQTSCVTPTSSLWDTIIESISGWLTETSGNDYNGDSDYNDSFEVSLGAWEGTSCGSGLPEQDACGRSSSPEEL